MQKLKQDKSKEAQNPHQIKPLLKEQRPFQFVTLRSICISCALMPILALWVVEAELIWYTGHSTAISLFYHVTIVIFILGLLNLLVKKKKPHWALTPPELLTIYMMLSIAATFCSHDMIQILIPMLTFPAYNANPQNRWDEIIMPFIKDWSIVIDREAIIGCATGNATIYKLSIFLAWLKPLLFWGFFLFVMTMGLLFLNVIFRYPWTERERLSFPVIQIPIILSTALSNLIRSKLFWFAFTITALIDIINGLNFLHPAIPSIPVIDIFLFGDYFVERPWDSIGFVSVSIYPFCIGLAYFLPTDLIFSCWFFYIFYKLQMVVGSTLGVTELPGFPFPAEQGAGGYFAVAFLTLWLARKHLRAVFKKIIGRPSGADDSMEPVRYRTAAIGFLVCMAILVFCGYKLGGTLLMMFSFFVIFFLYSIAIARIRAELGPPAHDLHFQGPEVMLHNAVGTRAAGEGNIAAFSLFYWFNRAYRAHFSAHSMEGFKIAQQTRIHSKSIMKAIMIAVIVGIICAFWAMLHATYIHGYSGKPAGDAFSCETWNRMAGWLSAPQKPNYGATSAVGFGFFFSLLLGFLRAKFTWWVWHPVGYAISSSWSMDRLWACLFITWLIKGVITRYGGAPAYRKALPFFVGLTLGEFVVGSFWNIYGAITSAPVYKFWG